MKTQFVNLESESIKKTTTPLVFEKKQNKSIVKPLKYINSDTGKTRHYPPAAQEWYNSIYTYNQNYIKSLPVLDKSLGILLKSYCNIWPKKRTNRKMLIKNLIVKRNLKGKNKLQLLRKLKVKPIIKYKRLSPKKVFVGKGELKHTNNKVIVTLYTYNVQKMFLIRKIKKLMNSFFLTKIPLVKVITWVEDDKDNKDKGNNKDKVNLKKVTMLNRRLTLYEYLNSSYNYITTYVRNPYYTLPPKYINKVERLSKIKYPVFLTSSYYNLLSYTILNVNKITKRLEIMLEYYKYLTELVENKILNENEKFLIFVRKASKFNIYKYRNKPRFILTKFKEKKIYLASLLRFAWLLYINDVKFKHPVLVSKLKNLVKNLYDKEVEFNIVELKKMHLSSDIFTQAVALKLKNRNNKLFRVLRSSLSKIDLPNVSRITERHSEFNRDEYLVNKIRNRSVNSMDYTKSPKIDSLNNLLLGLFPSVYSLKENAKEKSSGKISISLKSYVIKSLKHLKLAGIRIEAKGRLTRRFTAQRSVFKMRWKGGLKNVDSSFKGLPAVMLRGLVKSNVQYSVIKSKNRNGAYGVKGWVGNK